jgi:hypothetical protein
MNEGEHECVMNDCILGLFSREKIFLKTGSLLSVVVSAAKKEVNLDRTWYDVDKATILSFRSSAVFPSFNSPIESRSDDVPSCNSLSRHSCQLEYTVRRLLDDIFDSYLVKLITSFCIVWIHSHWVTGWHELTGSHCIVYLACLLPTRAVMVTSPAAALPSNNP